MSKVTFEEDELTVVALFHENTRKDTIDHQHANVGDLSSAHGFHTTTSTSYYVTFLVESGDRIELCVSGTEYGMLVEGDTGRLTFQGTRYLSFERI